MPILKQLVLGSSGSKRRSRADLTVEMISPPLADFRHTLHIGRCGDVFGDMSFLSTPQESTNQMHKSSLLPLRFRGSKRSHSERHSSAVSYMLPANSAISLPYVCEDQDLTFCLPKSTSLDFSETNGRTAAMGGWSLEPEEQCFGELSELPSFTPSSEGGMKHAESVLSFHIDLGPSMLGDILRVMDQKEQDRQDITEDQRQDWDMPRPLKGLYTSYLGLKEDKTRVSETCSMTYNFNINDKDFLFMDEEEDEIRV